MDLFAGLAAARSFLIFPWNDERRLAGALASRADAVVLDLPVEKRAEADIRASEGSGAT